MGNLFDTGIRGAVDAHLLKLAETKRDYGEYFSASSAGYCMRRNIFERLKVPHVKEDARKQRVFAVGDIFHEFMQKITKEAGLSIAQELELQDEDLMIRGHIDDLVLVGELADVDSGDPFPHSQQHLILYDYKSQSSRAFSYQSKQEFQTEVRSYFHKMQLGTYMYMLRKNRIIYNDRTWNINAYNQKLDMELVWGLTEARILKISKDDLRMTEEQLLWSDELEEEVLTYWKTLNKYWKDKKLPPCTCKDREGGFLAREAYNPYFYDGEPCSISWYNKHKKEEIAANDKQESEIILPTEYSKIPKNERYIVREKYIQLQEGKCFYCEKDIHKDPPKRITEKQIDWSKFPKGFLDYPVHLQHNHDTDMTEGAVHNYCNAVMWQYEGR